VDILASMNNLVPDSFVSYLFTGADSETLRDLFVYRFNAVDGFSPYNRGREDLTWDNFSQGTLSVLTRDANYPPELGLPGAYNTGDLAQITLNRKLDIDIDGELSFVCFDSLEATTHDFGEGEIEVINLSDFVPEDYRNDSYYFSFDGKGREEAETPLVSWETLQESYYKLDSQRTWFGDGDPFSDDAYGIRYISQLRIVAR